MKATLGFQFLRFAVAAVVALALTFAAAVFVLFPGPSNAAAGAPTINVDQTAKAFAVLE